MSKIKVDKLKELEEYKVKTKKIIDRWWKHCEKDYGGFSIGGWEEIIEELKQKLEKLK